MFYRTLVNLDRELLIKMKRDIEELIEKLESKASDLDSKIANENRTRDRAAEIEDWEIKALLLRSEAARLRLALEKS